MQGQGEYHYSLDVFLSVRGMRHPDPYHIEVYTYLENDLSTRRLVIKTETTPTRNHDFAVHARVLYYFEKVQHLHFRLVSNQKCVAEAQSQISTIMGTLSQSVLLDVRHDKQRVCHLAVRAEKVQNEQKQVRLKLHFSDLNSPVFFMKFWHAPIAYLKLLKKLPNGSYQHIHVTESIQSKNPHFNEFYIPFMQLCDGLPDNQFKVLVYDKEEGSEDLLVGQINTSLAMLSKHKSQNKQIKLKRGTTTSGKVAVVICQLQERPTFVSYLRGGLDFFVTVAIDFTASNLQAKPRLHDGSSQNPSQYLRAIRSVLRILQDYNQTKQILSLGFGAEIKSLGSKILHSFPLSCRPDKQLSSGIEQLQANYLSSLDRVRMAGPTFFNEILRKCRQQSERRMANLYQYQIIVILTDGMIVDMRQTIDEIFKMARLPISIIIIGIGSADFSAMVELDGDNGLLNRKGEVCPRDLVQFVEFNSANNDPGLLRSLVLEELPQQLVEYYHEAKIPPRQSMQAVIPGYNTLRRLQTGFSEGSQPQILSGFSQYQSLATATEQE